MASRYFWITLACACLVSWFYFGDIWRAPDSYLFTSSGDGLQGYYQTAWHVRYDSSDWQQQSLNYPFGESVFFTGGQPILSNSARVLGITDGMIGVSNVFLLSSGIFSTLLVFLIFSRFGLPGPYACLYSTGLVMLSQQWERLSGHFALSVMWAIPMLLWMFFRYFEGLKDSPAKNRYRAIGIAIALFILGLIQLYYLFFAAVLMAAFTLVYLLRSQITRKLQFLIQSALIFLLPFVLLQTLMLASSDVTDRTAIPWGFLVYRSSLLSYLYPFGMPYEHWFAAMKPSSSLEWEGLAFIGLSTIMALIIAGLFALRERIGKRNANPVSADFSALSALAVAFACCVLVSMAFPFNVGFETMLYQLGSVQQFRGIGRFAFVAFYPVVIFAVVVLFRAIGNSNLGKGLSIAIGMLLLVEGHARMSAVSDRISNPRQTVLRGIDDYTFVEEGRYQAIHPMPYVHVGSENIGFTSDDEAMRRLYDASYTLGMPSTATVMSRTSLSQSFLSCAMEWEIMETPAIVSQFPDQRPLLVLVDREHIQERHERLLSFAEKLHSDGRFEWYSMPLSAFEDVRQLNEMDAQQKMSACVYGVTGEWVNDSVNKVVYNDTTLSVRFSRGWLKLLEQPCLPEWTSDTLAVSFWVSNFTRDLIPRTVVEFIQYNSAREVVDYQTEFMGKRVIGIRGANALVEYTLPIQPGCAAISMSIENKLIQGQSLQINSLLWRPQSMNCRILRTDYESLNNRNYSR